MPELSTLTNKPLPDFTGSIEINQQADFDVDEPAVRKVVAAILSDAGYRRGAISIAIVDDPTIHALNKQFLSHDYETDVLSFILDADSQRNWIEGEVIASFDTARRMSVDYGWQPVDELLMYIVHGTLHLTGMDDATDEMRAAMQESEARYLKLIGRTRPPEPDSVDGRKP